MIKAARYKWKRQWAPCLSEPIRKLMDKYMIFTIKALAQKSGLDRSNTAFKMTRRVVEKHDAASITRVTLGPVIQVARVLKLTPGQLVDIMYAEVLKNEKEKSERRTKLDPFKPNDKPTESTESPPDDGGNYWTRDW